MAGHRTDELQTTLRCGARPCYLNNSLVRGQTMAQVAHIFSRFRRITRRAERVLEDHRLEHTFVNVAGIDDIIFNPENQILYGRRGTGKTHALNYLRSMATARGEVAVLIDLRSVGSEGSIWSDRTVPAEIRVPKVVTDILAAVHEAVYELATSPTFPVDLGDIAEDLDRLADQIGRVVVAETVEVTEASQSEQETRNDIDVAANWRAALALEARHQRGATSKTGSSKAKKESGSYRYKLHFQSLMMTFRNLLDKIGQRTWILLDEWSTLPEDIQPFVADAIKRTIFPISKATVVIAAIEHRAKFQTGTSGSIVGIEIGADCPAAINLDEYLVYENNKEGAIEFYAHLLYLHTESVDSDGLPDLEQKDADQLVKAAFTNSKCFQELVISSEGVPRDFINILSIACSKAGKKRINVPAVREAAQQWFEQDKSQVLRSNEELRLLLAWIADRVIGARKARAFLVDSGNAYSRRLMDLFDSRLIHVLKRSISTQDQPGVRYIAYKLDYGCYVELLLTSRKPNGLFHGEDVGGDPLEVPTDDYRSIRRSVLDISEFDLQGAKEQLRALLDSGDGNLKTASELFSAIISSALSRR